MELHSIGAELAVLLRHDRPGGAAWGRREEKGEETWSASSGGAWMGMGRLTGRASCG